MWHCSSSQHFPSLSFVFTIQPFRLSFQKTVDASRECRGARRLRARGVQTDAAKPESAGRFLSAPGGSTPLHFVPALLSRAILAEGTTCCKPLPPASTTQQAVRLLRARSVPCVRSFFLQRWFPARPSTNFRWRDPEHPARPALGFR